MFPVGALNPQPGNAAREQLLNQLVQQLQQRRSQAQQNVVTPASGFFDFMKKRQQQQQALSGAARPAGAGSQTALTALTNAHAILPALLTAGLGAAAPRGDSAFMSGQPGAPVPQAPGGEASHPMVPAAPAPGAAGGTMSPVPAAIPSVPHTGGGGAIPAGQGIVGSSSAAHTASYAGTPAGALTTPSGLVPISPGVYLNPTTGQLFGGSGSIPGGRLVGP